MKVAITTSGDNLDAPVDPRFGRAKNFIIYDTEKYSFALVDNVQNMEAAQGAGIQAAKLVADRGAQVVMTGHCGPKAFRTLQAAGIEISTGASGTLRQAAAEIKA